MGQEVYRQGLIVRSILDGTQVLVEIGKDHFNVAMLEMYLQMHYPNARIPSMAHEIHWSTNTAKILIDFGNTEDAMHFHLRH